jgi:hypothetical protein
MYDVFFHQQLRASISLPKCLLLPAVIGPEWRTRLLRLGRQVHDSVEMLLREGGKATNDAK